MDTGLFLAQGFIETFVNSGAIFVDSIIPSIVEKYVEEAAFLWLIREGAVRAPHYRLWELAKLDNRISLYSCASYG